MYYNSADIYKHFIRFNDLIDLVNKKDGRNNLTFEDQGYVDDIDLFLTGCIYHLPVVFFIDAFSVNKRILNCPKKFKTMLDFYNGIIKCKGKYISELQGFEKFNFNQKEILTFNISPASEHYDDLVKFFKM